MKAEGEFPPAPRRNATARQDLSGVAGPLGASAASAAAYLDACDEGLPGESLDPAYYRACGGMLTTLFTLVDAESTFPDLLKRSAAAREVAQAISIGRRLEAGRGGGYPRLAALLRRIGA